MDSSDPCNGLPGTTFVTKVYYVISYKNECSSSKTLTVNATDEGSVVASKDVTIPTGSGELRGHISLDRGIECMYVGISGADSGNC